MCYRQAYDTHEKKEKKKNQHEKEKLMFKSNTGRKENVLYSYRVTTLGKPAQTSHTHTTDKVRKHIQEGRIYNKWCLVQRRKCYFFIFKYSGTHSTVCQ